MSLKKDASIFTMGVTIRWIINHWFDYLLYPIVLGWLDSLRGGVVLVVLSMVINVALIRAYDWSKTDWFMIEKIKHLGDQIDGTCPENMSKWMVWLLRHTRKHPIYTFFVLCWDDPITVTLYFRKGSYQYNGMSSKEWKIFLSANLVANFYWICIWAPAVAFIKWIFV